MHTSRPLPNSVKTIGLIGGGTIGSSWAAYYLAHGFEVIVVDPYITATSLKAAINQLWPALEALGLPAAADKDRITLQPNIDPTLVKVDFVQENSLENLALKQAVIDELEEVIRADVIISSSTSSLLASDIQAGCQHPERVLVGHPFNPPHLLPLVEVVAGQKTTAEVVDWTMAFYEGLGKHPVQVKKEVIGHIANRLTAALYREAVHLVAEGIGSVADVDAAVTQGPGLRWALMGPHLTYHLGGGEGGIEHYLEHLGPTQENRWKELGQPQLTETVKQQLIAGVFEMVKGQSIAELAQQRDTDLVQLLNIIMQG